MAKGFLKKYRSPLSDLAIILSILGFVFTYILKNKNG